MVLRSLLNSAIVAMACAVVAAACSSFSSDGSGETGDAATEGGASAESGATDGGAGDAATSPDGDAAIPPAADPGVFCGAGPSCNPQTEVCCDHLDGGGVGCIPKAGAANCQGGTLGCDDGADCTFVPDGVCCGDLGSNGRDVLQSNCFALNDCKRAQFWVVVCDPSAARASTACPGGVPCNVPDGGGFGFCEGLVHP